MINLHLLTKISGKDHGFRKSILKMVSKGASAVIVESKKASSSEDWNKCYVILRNYISSIQPYCQLSYFNSLYGKLEQLKESEKKNLKRDAYTSIVESINKSLVSLTSSPEKGTTRLSSNEALEF